MRSASLSRKTSETNISVSITLDGSGTTEIETGIGFFDHMLEQLGKHSLIDLKVKAEGDLHIDPHHTVEDVGLSLGQCLAEALGEKKGIFRYGHFRLVMDEALAAVALDFSGRPHLVWSAPFSNERIGEFDTQLAQEFFQALSNAANMTLNISATGANDHHICEAIFKGVAKSIRVAVEIDPRNKDQIPSTKGTL